MSTQILTRNLLIACGLLAVLLLLFKTTLVLALLPLFKQTFAWIAPEFKIVSLALAYAGADEVVEIQVIWSHIQVIGSYVIYPDPRGIAQASTLSAHALQAPGIALAVAACWPTLHVSPGWQRAVPELLARIAIGLLAAFCLAAVDLPLTLAGELWSLVYDTLDPGRRDGLVIAHDFLQAGGRFALGGAAGLLSVHAGRVIVGRLRPLRGR